MKLRYLIAALLVSHASAQVTIAFQASDLSAIPGSTRRLYANVSPVTNTAVTWAVTGPCSLGSTSTATAANSVHVTASSGASCVSSTTATPSFTSAVSCTITATAVADTSQSASYVLPVCAPPFLFTVFPVYTIISPNQPVVIQSDLRGNVNTGVTWAITTNPSGAGSIIGGTGNRHAVFQATAAGTYVLTATSKFDTSKTSTSTIVVTASTHGFTPDHTEAIDCSAVGSGTTYEVGPARAFHDLNAVPWNSVTGGDTVRIHNDDTTGLSPTVYAQRVSLRGGGTATQALHVCGVPDSLGNKPIIDGNNSTTRSDADWARGVLDGLGIFTLYDGPHKFDATFDGNYNVIIEGLHIRNSGPPYTYTSQAGATTSWIADSDCLRIQTGRQILIRGNWLENCSEPIFMNSQTPQSSSTQDITVEGNYVVNWGVNAVPIVHAMYLQAIGLTAQFNYIAGSNLGAQGNLIKSRSVLNFLRWNYLKSPTPSSGGITSARAFDMVEPQAFSCYVIPHEWAKGYHGVGSTDCLQPGGGLAAETVTPDEVAANFEAYHSDYIYGNIMDDSGTNSGFVHYGYDQQTAGGPGFDRRGGSLFYWNNTTLYTSTSVNGKLTFETAVPDGGPSYEYPSVYIVNSAFATSTTVPLLLSAAKIADITTDTTWFPTLFNLPTKTGNDFYAGAFTAAELATCNPFNACAASNGHLLWARNGTLGTAAATLYTGGVPFDTSFIPSSALRVATALPAAIADQPNNMQFRPVLGTISPVTNLNFLGALDDGTVAGPPPTNGVVGCAVCLGR